MQTRRSFLAGVGVAAASAATSGARVLNAPSAQGIARFAPWAPGQLDIHHISTGRGSSTLFICPDGTVMLVDAGAIYTPLKYTIAPKPDDLRRPGEYLGRYIKRQLTSAGRKEIDVFLPTHFHDDHVGAVSPVTPLHSSGLFHVTGISDVATAVPVLRIVDRCFPSYDYPAPLTREDSLNYAAFAKYSSQSGVRVERFVAGSSTQVGLVHNASRYPSFQVQNLCVNGNLWTGEANHSAPQFPAISSLSPDQYPSENMCSLAFRLQYGNFRYYTGGDLESDTDYGRSPWRDIESAVARVAGPVNVAVANHHGYVNAVGPSFVQHLRPQAFIISGWDSAHPTITTLDNMLSKQLYPDAREIFATALKEENRIATRRLAEITSGNGHVVIRVQPGGNSYQIVVLDNMVESNVVLAEHGPYQTA
jgi:beta-lactamase superfamily II metal-dependent hydrolase